MDSPAGRHQSEILRGLMQAHCFPHAADHVEQIETHISTVLLAGDYAYKIKKPVNLGFLDFTTLEKRRYFCREEIRLNRRLAPGLYLDVVAIVLSKGSLRIAPLDSPGVVEYAVRMRRFEQTALLDHMLASGKMMSHHLDDLAKAVANFHSQSVAATDGEYGSPASIAEPVLQNFRQIRSLLEANVEIAEIDHLEHWSTEAFASLASLMEERRRKGFIRECHGDLHLGNIIWNNDGIQIFDCIEFNPSLRWIDVASEIAFTIMDLYARGRPDWGARFLNAYLESTGDYTALRLLPFYLVYRAIVRAKVARIRSTQASDEERDTALADYAEHVRLAISFTTPRRLMLMITRGVSGSGKTTVSQRVLEQYAALRLRSDVLRKRLHGLQPESRSNSALAADLYADSVSRATYAELHGLAKCILGCGFPVVVDATFLKRSQREPFERLAEELGIPFMILDCSADCEELCRRVSFRKVEGKDASEANLAVLKWQLANDQALDANEMKYAIAINTLCLRLDDISGLISQRIGNV